MVQTGDPTGTGKGGQSIWDRPFENELKSTLKVPHHPRVLGPPPLSSFLTFFLSLPRPVQQQRPRRNGQFRRQLQQVPVLHHLFQAAPPRWQLHVIRKVRLVVRSEPLFSQIHLSDRVIDGVDTTLDAIEREPVDRKNRPLKEVRLEKVRTSEQLSLFRCCPADNRACRSLFMPIPSRTASFLGSCEPRRVILVLYVFFSICFTMA